MMFLSGFEKIDYLHAIDLWCFGAATKDLNAFFYSNETNEQSYKDIVI